MKSWEYTWVVQHYQFNDDASQANWNSELLSKEERKPPYYYAPWILVYLCLEDQVPSVQKECDTTGKDSVKISELLKLDMEILYMGFCKILVPGKEKIERAYMDKMNRDLFIILALHPLEEPGIIKWSLNYPPPARDLRGDSLWKLHLHCSLGEVPQTICEIHKGRLT